MVGMYRVYVCMYVCMHVCTYVRMYVYMYVCNMAFITNHKPNTVNCMNKQLTQV